MELLTQRLGLVGSEWSRALSQIFLLDRQPKDEKMSKCEVALFLASCRMHHDMHYLSFIPGHASPEMKESWRKFRGKSLFPQTTEDVQLHHDLMNSVRLFSSPFDNELIYSVGRGSLHGTRFTRRGGIVTRAIFDDVENNGYVA